jgi:fatty-acyl-CoA synthase
MRNRAFGWHAELLTSMRANHAGVIDEMTTRADVNSDSPLKAWLRALEKTALIARNPFETFSLVIENTAEKFGDAAALLSDRECLTYRGLAEKSNRYARWALREGVGVGDVVCLLMPNCPEYMAIWLGITRIGGVVALINTNLREASLAHCINIVAPKHVIVASGLVDAFNTASPLLSPGVRCWAHGQGSHGLPCVEHACRELSCDKLIGAECRRISVEDPALYVYTSGTTGLPKAATVSHFRVLQWAYWFAGMMDTCPSDRMYNCLPMYHSIGGVVATGAVLVNGGSVFVRERFSASHFWDDVVQWNCTLFQYIGELCRYLVNSPPHALETEHRLRLCCGNGLALDVWNPFKHRFRIPQVLEYYAATEANFSLYNFEGHPGSIGRVPSFLSHRFPVALVRYDVETGAPARDGEGFCVRCAANEVGEAIGQIRNDRASLTNRFEGYTDKVASERKILRDVFVKGDAWYRSGDLMRKDAKGYFYFIDRVGDTFRWKGENVSAAEVATALTACPGIAHALVYGVTVAGAEGRAGMAAIVVGDSFDLALLRKHVSERLPEYARPLFLRIRSELETTSTFRPKSQDLARQGYDPSTTSDPVYFNDHVRQAFVRLDADIYQRIQSGEIRL